MTITTQNIDSEYVVKLAKLAELDKRSKTQELHFLIDSELERRTQEVFQD